MWMNVEAYIIFEAKQFCYWFMQYRGHHSRFQGNFMTFCEASNKRFLDFDLEKLENAIIQFFLPLYKGLYLGF